MELTFQKIMKIIWKNIIFIAVLSVICAVGAYLISNYTIPKTYVSKIGFTVVSTASDTNTANPSYLATNANYTRDIVRSKVELLKTNDYYQMIADQVNSDIEELAEFSPEDSAVIGTYKESPSRIKKALSFAIIEDTALFTIKVTTNSAGESLLIARAIEKTANTRLTELSSYNPTDSTIAVADTVKCYETPLMGTRSGPNITVNTIIGLLIGFAAAFLISLIRDMLDVRVKNVTDLKSEFDLPVLGTVMSFKTVNK